MVSATLLAAALVALVSAAAYGTVAWQLRRRAPADEGDRWALQYFVIWWAATATNILIAGFLYLAAAFDKATFEMQLADSVLQRILLAASLWGLLTYLLYLVFERRLAWLTGLAYAAHAVFMVSMIFASEPNGVFIGDWRTDLEYSQEPPSYLGIVNLFAVVLAPVVASVAYLVIAVRLPRDAHQEQRFRAIVVSCALIFWWVVAVTAGQRALLDVDWLQLVNRFLGLAAAVAILVAYNPPALLRRRWAADKPRAASA